MKLLVKNKLFSLGQGSTVFDENNEIVYKVKGSFWSNKVTKLFKKKIKDKNGKKLFVVRNKFWHKPFHRSAIIFSGRKKLAVVTNSHLLKNGYEVTGATKPISVEGTGWNLDIKLGDEVIGKISLPEVNSVKDLAKVITDTFVLDVFSEEDAPFLVAMMIAIDNVHDQQRNS